MDPIPTLAAWIDLRGFGAMLKATALSADHPELERALARLKNFHATLRRYLPAEFAALVVNDGCAMVHDRSTASPGRGARTLPIDFLRAVAFMHYVASHLDSQHSSAGIRTVVCAGFRLTLGEESITTVGSVLRAARASGIRRNDDEALEKFWANNKDRLGVAHYIAHSQLQFNLALSKAWIADHDGVLRGPGIFLEAAVLRQLGEVVLPCEWGASLGAFTVGALSERGTLRRRCEQGCLTTILGVETEFAACEAQFFIPKTTAERFGEDWLERTRRGDLDLSDVAEEFVTGQTPPWY